MAFISEIHFRNSVANTTNVDEFIEVTLTDEEAARAATGDFTITLYQQNGVGTVFNLSAITPVDHPTNDGFQIFTLVQSTTAPDDSQTTGEFEGIAFADGADVISFFDIQGGSGTIDAINGPAAGMTSTTIATGGGESIQFDILGNRVDGALSEDDSIVCFARDTYLRADGQDILVQDLKPGDLVQTQDRGLQPVAWVCSRRLSNSELLSNPKLRPIRISAGALGDGIPKQDLIVSRQHRIQVRSKITQRMFGFDEVLLPAIKLVGLDGIDILDDVESVEYFHVLFDQHEIVVANGAPTESFFLGKEALSALTPEAQLEITTIFPEITTLDFKCKTVRFVPKPGATRNLVARHVKNNQDLVASLGFPDGR